MFVNFVSEGRKGYKGKFLAFLIYFFKKKINFTFHSFSSPKIKKKIHKLGSLDKMAFYFFVVYVKLITPLLPKLNCESQHIRGCHTYTRTNT